MGGETAVDWKATIVSTLKGEGKKRQEVKKLRKSVLLSLQLDKDDKAAKKAFKKAVQELEEEETVKLDSDGIIKLKKGAASKHRSGETNSKSSEKKKKRKRSAETEDGSDGKDEDGDESLAPDEKRRNAPNTDEIPETEKNKPCKGNPQGVTRLFLGNLPFRVDENALGYFLPGTMTHVKWITDQESGRFYGSAFCEMDNSVNAAAAVAMAGQKLMGRPIKINFAAARPGDVWPPTKNVTTGGVTTGGQAGGSGRKAMSEKPDNCVKLFIGNLSYEIDDETITKFFANVDAEVKAVRWLHHRDTGDFKGCGFVEFWNTEACDKGATLNGKNLLGRPIRIDWTD